MLEAKFHEERAALEAKYQKLYEPLYSKVAFVYVNLFLLKNFAWWSRPVVGAG